MLVYEQNGYIFALGREAVEGLLDVRILGLTVDHEEVLLRVRRLGDVLRQYQISSTFELGRNIYIHQRLRAAFPLLYPDSL